MNWSYAERRAQLAFERSCGFDSFPVRDRRRGGRNGWTWYAAPRNRIYLAVPRHDYAEARCIGAKYDREVKALYTSHMNGWRRFSRWITPEQRARHNLPAE